MQGATVTELVYQWSVGAVINFASPSYGSMDPRIIEDRHYRPFWLH